MKNTQKILMLLSLANLPVAAMIPNASYVVYQGTETAITGGIPGGCKEATVYDPQGNVIEKKEGNLSTLMELRKKLDPKAKPQPNHYAIKWWPAFQLGFGLTKGVPGYFVVFYDKHGNVITSKRYDEKSNQALVFSQGGMHKKPIAQLKDLDLKNTIEKDSDPIVEGGPVKQSKGIVGSLINWAKGQ